MTSLKKDILRCKSSTKREITINSLVCLVIVVMGLLCFFSVKENEGIESALYMLLVFIVGIGTYIFFSLRKMKESIALNKKKEERINNLSESEISELERQIENTEFQYKTFYMLDDFFYVPKYHFLIKYTEIKEFKNIIHSTNGVEDSMIIAVTDTDGFFYKMYVKQWKEYQKYCNSVAETIYQKKNI